MVYLLLALTLLAVARADGKEQADRPHCADFMQFCTWNASTSSCEFQKSVTFGCGPRASAQSMASWSSSTDTDTTVGEEEELTPAAILDSGCRWDVSGDLRVASGVEVEVEGDDCLLHIGSGKMVLLEFNATLRAASLSVEASFVHLKAHAEMAAAYSGNYHGVQGIFTGTDVFGASYGGGGGQRLIANSTMLTQQTTRGFFDVRGRTVHLPSGNEKEKEKILRESSGGWYLANVWAEERSVLTSTAAVSSSSSEGDEDRSAQIARLLLGSGSRVVVIGNDTQEHVLAVDGGGRIQIIASKDVVVMKGARIQANGASAVEGVSGGSGGSVFVSATALSVTGSIEARGGDAFCSDKAADRGITYCYPAGGGGRVQVSFMSSQLSSNAVDTTGGSLDGSMVETLLTKSKRFRAVQVTSLAGAAGTYYQVAKHSDGAHEAQLLISNGLQKLWPDGAERSNGDPVVKGVNAGADKVVGGAVTSLHIGNDKPGNVNALTVTDGAIVASNCLHVSTGDLKVLNGSYLVDALLASATDSLSLSRATSASDMVSSVRPVFQMRVRDLLVSSNSRLILPTSALQLSARSVSMDATAALRFTWSAQITTSQNLHLDANVSSALTPVQPSSNSGNSPATGDHKVLELVSGGNVFIGGYVVVGALSISSGFSITIDGQLEARNAASIKSTFNTCKQQTWTSKGEKHAFGMDKKDISESDTPVPPLPTTLPTINNFTVVLHARESIYLGQSEEVKEGLKEELAQEQEAADPLLLQPVGIVRGGAVLVCAADTIEISLGSMISSDGMGELANQGPGTGSCARSVGGGAGYGGRGADSSVVSKIGEYAAGGLPYGTRSGAGMLGSGGGCVGGGNSGGVIMLGASGLVLNGGVRTNGDGGVNGGGGGSGGFLGISISQFLRGHGHISSVGGGSECAEAIVTTVITETKKTPSMLEIGDTTHTDAAAEQAQAQVSKTVPRLCGGGGGGGRLQLTGCELSSFDRCTSGFDGNYTVAGGATVQLDDDTKTDQVPAPPLPTPASSAAPVTKSIIPAGASGSFFGFPCPPGSGGLFCRLCVTGKFKSESNSAECVACSNAPSNAHYIGVGASSSSCDWACDPGYSGYYCVSPLEQLLDACGGEFGFALVLMGIVTFFILLGYACRNHKEPSYMRMYNSRATKEERQHLLSSAVGNSQRSRVASLFHCLFWPRVSYPKLLERDLPEHMARLYFSGHNDPESPLKLRTTVPQPLANVLYEWEFKKLADRINAALSWRRKLCSSWGKIVYFLVWLLCYPFASEVMLFRRHMRVNALKRLVATYNHACMKGPRARGLLNAVKLGYCADYSLVYLELLYKESSQSVCVPTSKIGKPSLPLVLLFAGCGTYFSPLFLDPNDLLVRSIPQCPELTAFIDEPWIEFVAELNELLRVVQRDEASLVESLLPVATFLEKRRSAMSANTAGKLGGLRIYLGRFYVQDELDMGEEFKLGIFLTTAEETVETVSSSHNLQSLLSGAQPPSSAGRFGYGNNSNNAGYPKDSSGYGYAPGNMNDVYGYGRGDSLDLLDPRGSGQQGGYAEALPYDMGGWGTALTSMSGGSRRSSNDGNPNNGVSAGGTTTGATAKNAAVSSIREEALRIRSSGSIGDGSNMGLTGLGSASNSHEATRGSGSPDDMFTFGGPNSSSKKRRESASTHRRRTFYEGWLGPVDASLPVPGVLIMADELRERLADRTARQSVEAFLRFHLLPRNLPRSSSLNLSWMLSISLLTLLMVDLAITFAMVVNLKCVTDGEVDHNCSASIMIPVLLVPPLALVVSPIMGIVSLALSSSTFTRRFSVWNALSMLSVVTAICACIVQSSRLVAPWFAGPLPLLPVIALAVKAGQAYLIERYIAFQETQRRRRGWRGIMKRRLSDASIPTESP